MSLASKVGEMPSTGKFWPPIDARSKEIMKAPTACHFATCYWLFEAAYDRPFTWDEFLALGDSSGFVASLLPNSVKLQQSKKIHKDAGLKVKDTGTLVPAGWVIVFSENGLGAGHSCIALTSKSIGGYNQTDWFSSPGKDHGYSVHSTLDIPWRTKHLARRFSKDYSLHAIPEDIAVNAMRAKGLV